MSVTKFEAWLEEIVAIYIIIWSALTFLEDGIESKILDYLGNLENI